MHKRIKLDGDDVDEIIRRPDLSVWTEPEDPSSEPVVLMVGASHGGQQRFVELKPAEARRLGMFLIEAAEIAEKQKESV